MYNLHTTNIPPLKGVTHVSYVYAGLWAVVTPIALSSLTEEPADCFWRETERGTDGVIKDARRFCSMADERGENGKHMAPITAVFLATFPRPLSRFFTCISPVAWFICSLSKV